MAGTQVRYGISALDLGYKEYAQNDELMVRGEDGRMYYKRTDGTVVSYSDKDLTEAQVITSTMGVLMGIDGLTLPTNEYLVYRTFNTTNKLDLITSTDVALNKSVTLSKNVPGFFFRVRGNDFTTSAAAILKAIYADKVKKTDSEVTMVFSISNNGANQQTVTVNAHLNDVTYVKFPTFTGTITNYIVKLTSISFPLYKAAFAAAGANDKTVLAKINNGNTKYDVNFIDFIGYASTIASLSDSIADDVAIKTVTSTSAATQIYTDQNKAVANVGGIPKTGFVISKENPMAECVWGKIVE